MPELPDADDQLEDDLTDSVPRITPIYADATYKELGERLAGLYFARDTEGADDDERNEAIVRTAASMRRGPRLHAGEFLADGRYRLIDAMGTGGSGSHWKAWDRTTGRFVYLTVFHDPWTDVGSEVTTFRRRGQQLVRLDHPNIGKVFDAELSVEGWVYVAQGFFAVGSLTGRVGRDTFDAIEALQVVVEVAEALRHAHDASVVHGDVRPENVMHSADGTAHLVDFAVGPATGTAGWGSLYGAPETSEKGYQPEPASDVYGLGMTALFALHKGDLPVWVLRDPGKLIESLEAPEALKRVIAKATEWDLSKRYPDVRTLLRELMSDPELVRTLADRALERKRLAVGAGHFEKLLKTQPHRGVEYRTILGDVYTEMGSYDQAHRHFAKALERTPDVESLFAPLRVVAERTGEWSRLAELLWTQARQRDAGRRVLLRAELADINEHQLEDATSAREVWGQVLAEHRVPDQAATALRCLMRLCKAADDGEAFVSYGQELLDYLPEGTEAAEVEYAIGRTLIEQLKRVDEGLPWIDRGEAHGHSELDFAPALQQIRAERGQWKRVIKLMIAQARQQELSEASPTLLRAGIIAGSVHHEEEAFEVYHSLLERAPRHVVALRHLARMHHRAHQHERALPFYERLWDTYKGRDTDEPEASERAADCTAYASILVRQGRADEAMERLHEAMRLTPFHVPSLQVAGPMLLARGEVDAAADVFERLLRAFKSVERTPQKVEALLGMGDLAWIQGRITPAMGWYNRALELEPFSVRAWWGLAKVALTGRGGHPGVERAPWVKAVPKRFSTSEALARLLGSMLDSEAMASWLAMTPLGAAIVGGGASPMRLACGVAEVLIRNELAGAELYDRLGEAFPEWAETIDVARGLCAEGRTHAFPMHVAYSWTAATLGDEDFSLSVERHVLPPEPAPATGTSDVLVGPGAWSTLFQNAQPKPTAPRAWIQEEEAVAAVLHSGSVAALVRDQAVWLLLDPHKGEVRFGREEAADMQIVHDDAVVEGHGRLFRQSGRVYVEAQAGPVVVDGEARELWRLVGGERVTVGETRFTFEATDDEQRLPPKRRKPARQPTPLPAPAAAAPEQLPESPDFTADDDPSVELEESESEPVVEDAGEEVETTQLVDTPPEVAAIIAAQADPVDDKVDVPPALTEADSDELLAMPSVSEEVDRAEVEEMLAESRTAPEASDLPEEVDDAEYDEVIERVPEPESDDELSVDAPVHVDESPPEAQEPEEPDEEQPDLEGEPIIIVDAPPPVKQPAPTLAPVDVDEPEVLEAPEATAAEPDEEDPAQADGEEPVLVESVPEVEAPAPEVVDDDEAGVFGFPAEFANDDVDSLQSEPMNLPSGVRSEVSPSTPPEPMMAPPPPADGGVMESWDDLPPKSEPGPAPEPEPEPEPPAEPPVAGLFTPTGADRAALDAALEYMSGADRGQQVRVIESLTVGQSKHCGMSIPSDTRLSPVHCKVERTTLGFKLVDEGSANGTVVNGARITEIDLHGGEVIMVGRTVLRFRLLEES